MVSSSQLKICRLAMERLSASQCMPAPSESKNRIIAFGHFKASYSSLALDDAMSDSAAVISVGHRISPTSAGSSFHLLSSVRSELRSEAPLVQNPRLMIFQ